ncbi:MAG TPA: pseudouridine synthase [Vicinamibacterales bacterium]|jgi:pseudouridine synthase|nr:pseudouridine synthase [Vicinamibacterales bacterium]
MDRIQKILSQAGVASRRASEQLMRDGRVTVNGEPIRQLGTKADPLRDDIRVDGRRVKIVERHRYILLNKPRGYVSTRSDPQRRPTLLDLLPDVSDYIYPVGRLDFDSEGLIVLTNDGDLAARLTHPRHGISRVYDARVLGVPDAEDLARLQHGVVIDGRRTEPADVRAIGPGHLRVVIREGRNRQVRKMCDAIGHPVSRLTRIAIGPLTDQRLKPGQWRELTAAEVKKLRAASDRPPSERTVLARHHERRTRQRNS